MKEGVYTRSFVATLPSGMEIQVNVTRFLSLQYDEVGVIRYEVTPLSEKATITFESYLDSSIENHDTNWEEKFWNTLDVKQVGNRGFIVAETKKTAFRVCTFMENRLEVNGVVSNIQKVNQKRELHRFRI
ncbi:hypothetical protein CCAN2_1920033 [Capnocytophaga canimorsus]|nr:hypothetical protein CCAN2_1920033 [Capnocytophaga canimorsus]